MLYHSERYHCSIRNMGSTCRRFSGPYSTTVYLGLIGFYMAAAMIVIEQEEMSSCTALHTMSMGLASQHRESESKSPGSKGPC